MKLGRMKKYICIAFNSLGIKPKRVSYNREDFDIPCMKIELDDESIYIYCEAQVPTSDDLILESSDRAMEDIWDEAYDELWFLAITVEDADSDDEILVPIAESRFFYQMAAKAAAYVFEQKAEDAVVDLFVEDLDIEGE